MCECCGKSNVTVVSVCIDDNYETELCKRCIFLIRRDAPAKVEIL